MARAQAPTKSERSEERRVFVEVGLLREVVEERVVEGSVEGGCEGEL